MRLCLRQYARKTAMVGLFAVAMTSASAAFASDPSLPYRNYPGFQCHQWNSTGGCSDFSYFDNGSAPSYASSAPAYNYSYGNGSTGCGYGINCNDQVSVRASASPNTAVQGGTLTYNLYVRNDDSQPHAVNVQAYLDSNTSFVSATFGGYNDGTVIHWNFTLAAQSSRTLVLSVHVNFTTMVLNEVVLRAQANTSTDSLTSEITGMGYGYVPTTYSPYDNGYNPAAYPRYTQRYLNNGGYYYNGYEGSGTGYYYDSNGQLQYTNNSSYGYQGSYYCNPTVYTCQ